MNGRRSVLWILILLLALGWVTNSTFAKQLRPNMNGSRLAEVQLMSRDDLKTITDSGGIIDNVRGTTAWVYLLPEDFETLKARGLIVHWIRDEAKEEGQRFWKRVKEGRQTLDDYHTNDQIQQLFANWQATYPTLFHYESIGLSVEGRNLWVAKVSDNVTEDEPEIEVKYVANMHGDEVVGKENCLRFIEQLLTQYTTDPELGDLMANYEMWFLPLMNPDGNSHVQRENADGVDLNRDFPDRIQDSVNTTAGRAIETAHVMNWSAAHNFVLSANFHGGALVVNYPWDGNASGQSIYTPTPEDPLFVFVSERYSSYNTPMWNSSQFTHGITNGADWYVIYGGMQDWNYVWMGDKEVTIELGATKWPPASQLEALWNYNRLSMRYYWLEAKYGIRGIVTDSATGLPLRANVRLGTIPYLTHSSELHGEYYRILRPGTYTLTFSAAGYVAKTFSNIVVQSGVPTVLDVQLVRYPSAVVSTDPLEISASMLVCDSVDVPLTIINSGDLALNWSAEEGYVNGDGYGSAEGGGWRFMDSDQSNGPAYNWRDISSQGTTVSFTSDDQNLGPFAIGFPFPYYGSTFSQYRMSANGWISFTSTATGATSYQNLYLPNSSAPENIIAAWWDDLSPQRSGTSVKRYQNGDSLIISFSHVQSYSGSGIYTFQYILLRTGEIVFQYDSMGTNRLNSATIGLQNSTKTKGSTVIVDQLYIHNQMAIAYDPRPMVELISLTSGSVEPHSSQDVVARARSCFVPLGETEGLLAITSNDPVDPVLSVPITLNVTLAPPDAVADLTIVTEGDAIRLNWSASADATQYVVYRSEVFPVEVSESNYIGTTAETTYLDSDPSTLQRFYVMTAMR